MSEIMIAGERFNVRLEGDESKPFLALAHQLGGSLAVWEPLMPALFEHFRVLRWDSRGHGASVANEGPYSIAQLARDAIAIFDALGIEKAHWLGLSMGAVVGQAALIAAPDRIGRAVLANTAAKLGTPDIWNARIRAALGDGMEAMAATVAARWFTPEFREAEPETVEAILFILREMPPQGYAGASAALRDVDQREAIRSIRNKVLVIVGRHDPSAPPELGAFVAGAIEGARLVTLESSHISPIEQAEAFARAAINFLIAPETPARRPPEPRKLPATRARQLLTRRAAAKAPIKRPAAKKTQPTTSAKKAPARKASAKKAPAKQAPAKSVTKAGGKAAVKKAAAKKAAAKKRPAAKSQTKAAKAKPALAKKAAAKATAKTAKKAAVKSKAANKPRRR
jgi:3-oxoadipate enol-lactonase